MKRTRFSEEQIIGVLKEAELNSRSHASQHGGMTETIARLHIALADTDPSIWRRVEVPVEASLKMLHDVIQGAMGWLDYHLWEFEADDRRYGVPDPLKPSPTPSTPSTRMPPSGPGLLWQSLQS